MAKSEKEEVIFQFKIEQGDAIQEMERFKKSIIQTKQEQAELNKAYRAGHITLNEFSQESTRLDTILKKNQSSYNGLQKSVTGVKTQIDKLIDSNQKTSQSFKDVAGNINIAGTNIGSLTAGFTKFLNPAGAALGVVTALGAAYTHSTRGAADLQKAQDLLSASSTVLSNKLFSGTGGDFSASSILKFLQGNPFTEEPATIIKSLFSEEIKQIDELAKALENLRKVNLLSMKDAQRLAKDALKDAELNRNYRDDETKALQNRLSAANDVEGSINAFESSLLKVQQERLAAATTINELANNSIESQALIKDIEREIADISEDAAGKRTEAMNGVLKIEKLISAEVQRQSDPAGGRKMTMAMPRGDEADALQAQTEFQSLLTEATVYGTQQRISLEAEAGEQILTDQQRLNKQRLQFMANANSQELEAIQYIAQTASTIFDEQTEAYKIIASIDALINTYKGANIALGTYPPPFSYIAAAATVAAGLANVHEINKAAGGGDFVTKGPALMLVGDNPGGAERVTVEPLSGRGQTVVNPHSNLIAMAGGGTVRAGDGGLMANSMTAGINENIMIANMLKKMPAPIVGVREFNEVANQVKVKQSVAKNKPFKK